METSEPHTKPSAHNHVYWVALKRRKLAGASRLVNLQAAR